MANFYGKYVGVFGGGGGGGGGGGSVPKQVIPTGVINNVNTIFTIPTPIADAAGFTLYKDGLILEQGVGKDYTVTGTTITLAVAPLFGQSLYAVYNVPSAGSTAYITAVAPTNSIDLTVTTQTLTADFRFGMYGTRAAPVAITAVGGLAFSGGQILSKAYVEGSGGAVIVTAIPAIAAGSVDGQELTIQSRSNTNTVRFNNGNGLVLNGPWIGLEDSVITLTWDGVNWVEKCRQ